MTDDLRDGEGRSRRPDAVAGPLEEPKRRGKGMKWLTIVVLSAVTIVVLCAAAASTRPAEFQTYSGFITREHTSMGERALIPSVLRGRHSHLAQLRIVRGSLADKETEDNPLTPEEVDAKAKAWASNHPHEMSNMYVMAFTGIVISCLGTVFLLTSEIHTVLLVRELDDLHISQEPMSVELEEREKLWGAGMNARWRPWISIAGVALMIVGGLVTLVPMCQVLADFGLPEAVNSSDCITSVFVIAAVGGVGWACFFTAICWACTRPWASLLLASISLGAQVTIGVASPILVLFWAVSSGFLAYLYLEYIPESRPGYHPPNWRTTQGYEYDRGGGWQDHWNGHGSSTGAQGQAGSSQARETQKTHYV